MERKILSFDELVAICRRGKWDQPGWQLTLLHEYEKAVYLRRTEFRRLIKASLVLAFWPIWCWVMATNHAGALLVGLTILLALPSLSRSSKVWQDSYEMWRQSREKLATLEEINAIYARNSGLSVLREERRKRRT